MFQKSILLKYILTGFLVILFSNLFILAGEIMAQHQTKEWPVLKHYDKNHINKSEQFSCVDCYILCKTELITQDVMKCA